MKEMRRNLLVPAAAGAALGFCSVLAFAVYAVVSEVYVGCGGATRGRCHDLGYAISMVAGPLFAYGALAAIIGVVVGFGVAVSIPRKRN